MEGRPGFLPTLFLGAVLAATVAGAPQAAETPKRGGILTYMIPADAPPSFDGHRETTFATGGTERIVARSHGHRKATVEGEEKLVETSTRSARYKAKS